jgi:hypothetical protein
MPPLRLNASDPKQVSSGIKLEALIGSPPSRLLIFTGIAMPELESNGLIDRQEVTVDLNARANAPNPPFTATVGLASVFNSDSDLLFAADDVRVVTGDNLELLLICNIAAMGDRSVLSRFSYQATVFLHADNGTISGNIRWNPHFLTFLDGELFQIEASTLKVGPGPAGGFGTTIKTVEGVGHTLGQPVRQGNIMSIPYEINNLPLGEGLHVTVVPNPGAFLVLNTSASFNFEQISGPSFITLSEAHLSEKPVDFEAREFVGPH